MYICWSVKGGSGTTVVAAALALLKSHRHPTLLVDVGGDVPAALGLTEPRSPGLSDWLASTSADGDALVQLAIEATDSLRVLPLGGPIQPRPDWARLRAALPDDAVVDLSGRVPPPEFVAPGDHSILVVRPCYLALRRVISCGHTPTGIVVVDEPGRALRAADVARAVGAPVVAEVPFDPALSRAVDAGLLATRLPRTIAHPLRGAA
ncbi:MAG: hypothetical protein ACKOA2_05970 [Ilumatobacteraceae bacterium]